MKIFSQLKKNCLPSAVMWFPATIPLANKAMIDTVLHASVLPRRSFAETEQDVFLLSCCAGVPRLAAAAAWRVVAAAGVLVDACTGDAAQLRCHTDGTFMGLQGWVAAAHGHNRLVPAFLQGWCVPCISG